MFSPYTKGSKVRGSNFFKITHSGNIQVIQESVYIMMNYLSYNQQKESCRPAGVAWR